MKYVDAHIHLSDEEYANCVEDVIAEAERSEVVAAVSNSMDLKTCVRSLELAKQFPRKVYAALGIHPWTVKKTRRGRASTDSKLDEKDLTG